MYIQPEEVLTHLFPEQIAAINAERNQNLDDAIAGALVELRGYLTAWNIDSELAKTEQRNPLLIIIAKDIAVWHYINICNVNTDLELRRIRYDNSIAWLKNAQKGNIDPSLPQIEGSNGKPERTPAIIINSKPKKQNRI